MEGSKITTDIRVEGTVVELKKSQGENSRYDWIRAYGEYYRRMEKDNAKGEMTYDKQK